MCAHRLETRAICVFSEPRSETPNRPRCSFESFVCSEVWHLSAVDILPMHQIHHQPGWGQDSPLSTTKIFRITVQTLNKLHMRVDFVQCNYKCNNVTLSVSVAGELQELSSSLTWPWLLRFFVQRKPCCSKMINILMRVLLPGSILTASHVPEGKLTIVCFHQQMAKTAEVLPSE